jgi:hypothetical protein
LGGASISREIQNVWITIMIKKGESYNNLIDVCLRIVEDPELKGKTKDQFLRLMTDYFFLNEKNENRNLELLLSNIEPPSFIGASKTILEIPIDELSSYVKGNTTNDSLAGKIMLSQQFLKAFYPHHAPSFNKLPEDVRFELMDAIKEKNETIISAFEKMMMDRTADKKRKVITLVALIIKNIHYKTGAPLNKLSKTVEETIRSTFHNTDEIFTASQKQMADLQDDTKIKQIVKSFFMIKQFKDITETALLFKEELERYRKRTIIAGS